MKLGFCTLFLFIAYSKLVFVMISVSASMVPNNKLVRAEVDVAYFGTGTGKLCYGCLANIKQEIRGIKVYPTFDVRNRVIKKSQKYGSCHFHTKARCIGASNELQKCYLRAFTIKKKVYVEKGCEVTTIKDGCYPRTVGSNPTTNQTCYCTKRLCNADLHLMGGSPTLTERIYYGGSGTRRMTVKSVMEWWLIILLMSVLCLVPYSDQLVCCKTERALTSLNVTDGEIEEGSPEHENHRGDHGDDCINQGTSCKDVRCSENLCEVDSLVQRTGLNCSSVECNTNWTRPACRILLFEAASDPSSSDLDENQQSFQEQLDLDISYGMKQDCFDNSFNFVNMGCEFHHKIFYLNRNIRITYQKECYCDSEDKCNRDLFYICALTDKNIKDANDTCQSSATRTRTISVLMLMSLTHLLIN